jgi:hypothetical protein
MIAMSGHDRIEEKLPRRVLAPPAAGPGTKKPRRDRRPERGKTGNAGPLAQPQVGYFVGPRYPAR